jgi:hypothetical protein
MKKQPLLPEFAKLLLFVSFGLAICKLAGLIDWSWWTVLSPIWFPLVVCLTLAFVAVILIILYAFYAALIRE